MTMNMLETIYRCVRKTTILSKENLRIGMILANFKMLNRTCRVMALNLIIMLSIK